MPGVEPPDDASTCFTLFLIRQTQSVAVRPLGLRLMHSGGAFIYSCYRDLRRSPFCIQMSPNVFRSLPTSSILQIR